MVKQEERPPTPEPKPKKKNTIYIYIVYFASVFIPADITIVIRLLENV